MQRINSVKNTCVNIAGKLPPGLAELYADINEHAKELAIDFLVVGAMARDLVLVHGFGSNIERGTRDDEGYMEAREWDEFEASAMRLGKDVAVIASLRR